MTPGTTRERDTEESPLNNFNLLDHENQFFPNLPPLSLPSTNLNNARSAENLSSESPHTEHHQPRRFMGDQRRIAKRDQTPSPTLTMKEALTRTTTHNGTPTKLTNSNQIFIKPEREKKSQNKLT